jgi:glyoxylase-like metal-dependent hydrolase (beta-lactamase superfamily II)
MALMSFAYPNQAIDLGARVRPLPDDGSVPHMPGWRWLHTAGHLSLFRDADRRLIAGDAFVTSKQESLYAVVTQEPEVHGPPAYFTPDWAKRPPLGGAAHRAQAGDRRDRPRAADERP